MKKHLIFPVAVLAFALTACGQREAEVTVTAPPTPTCKPTVTAAVSVAPTAEITPTPVTGSPVPEPTPAEVTAQPTPAPVVTPAPKQTPETIPDPAPTPEPTPALPPEAISTPEPVLPTEPERPGDEEVLAAYHTAAEAYAWFDLTTLPVISDNGVIGPGYYPVADERFPTMEALRAYLKELFSDEVVDQLLPMGGEHYVEIDGVLCAAQADRGTNENSGPVTETVIRPEEGADTFCTVRVTVELLWEDPSYPEGKRVYDFPYQKVGDKWVFTHFESIM